MEGEPGPSDLQPHFHPDPQLGAPARRDHYRPSGGADTGTAGSGKHGIDSESIARDAPGSRRGRDVARAPFGFRHQIVGNIDMFAEHVEKYCDISTF